ncbi:MAG: hypothetical protein AAGI51_01825 [Pseudomonadota bacterium]
MALLTRAVLAIRNALRLLSYCAVAVAALAYGWPWLAYIPVGRVLEGPDLEAALSQAFSQDAVTGSRDGSTSVTLVDGVLRVHLEGSENCTPERMVAAPPHPIREREIIIDLRELAHIWVVEQESVVEGRPRPIGFSWTRRVRLSLRDANAIYEAVREEQARSGKALRQKNDWSLAAKAAFDRRDALGIVSRRRTLRCDRRRFAGLSSDYATLIARHPDPTLIARSLEAHRRSLD